MRLRAKELREALGVTQAKMSADTGLSQATISKIETGSQNATLGTLDTVATYLGVSARDLFEASSPEWVEASAQPHSAAVVGRRLRRIRHAHGLSQSQFVRVCGGSITVLSNWEQGRSRPKIDAAARIIAVFGLTLDYLYLGDVGTLRHSVAMHLNEG